MGKWGATGNPCGVSFWSGENILKLTVAMSAQLYEYAENYRIIYFKMGELCGI